MDALFKELNQALVNNLGRPRTALLLGTSVGETAYVLKGKGSKTTAIELNKDALGKAQDLADEAFLAADPHGNPLASVKGRTFDLIALEGSLERANDYRALLAQAKEHLTDGGHLVVSFPQTTDFSRADVADALEAAGFEIMRYDMNPVLLRRLLSTGARAMDDLRVAHTTSFRYTRELVRPLELAVARNAPDSLAADHVFVARVPPKPGKLSLTVGMLTLNEEESVERMIDGIREVAPDAKILLIDSSSDRTPELARAKGARVVRQLPPQGHGPAMERLMYEAAADSDALIYLDCDFTYPTHFIPVMRQLLEDGADLINGSRTAKFPKGAMPVPNFIANRVFAATAHAVHGVPTTDVHSGMRAYRLSMVRAFAFDGGGDALPLDTLILPARSNYRVIEFPIPYTERVGTSKLARVRGALWTYLRIAGAVGQGTRVGSRSHYSVVPTPRVPHG